MSDPAPPIPISPPKDYKHYFFLLYHSDPTRGRVTIYVDGDERRVSMKHQQFLDLIVETAGWPIEPAIKGTLNTYGTLWLLDRERLFIDRIVASGTEDLINVQKEIQASLAQKQADQQAPVNSLVDERYAGGTIELPAMANMPTPYDTANTRHNRRSRFGINIPGRR